MDVSLETLSRQSNAQIFRYPVRIVAVLGLAILFGIWAVWHLQTSAGRSPLWGLTVFFTLIAAASAAMLRSVTGRFEVTADSIRHIRLGQFTEIPWSHVTEIQDAGVALTIRTSGASIRAWAYLDRWQEFCDLVHRYATVESKPQFLPLRVRRGWGQPIAVGMLLLMVWLALFPLFGASFEATTLSVGIITMGWVLFAERWRAGGWVFDRQEIRIVRLFATEVRPASALTGVAIVRGSQSIRHKWGRHQMPVAALCLEFCDGPPVLIPAAYLDEPLNQVRDTLIREYKLGP